MAKTPDWASPLAKRNSNADPKNVDPNPVRTNEDESYDSNASAWEFYGTQADGFVAP
jgi:hypothetical protein